jgi:predicted RNA-binding Zn-ribbon protein involved in translation (DUF1610 family)
MRDAPPPPPPADVPIEIVDDEPPPTDLAEVLDEVEDPPLAGASTNASGDQRMPRRFPCRQCGAELVFAPGTTTLTCRYCGTENAIPTSADQVRELDFKAYVAKLQQDHAGQLDTHEVCEVRCDACAAEVTCPENLDNFACPFCGANIESAAVSRRLIKPAALLPFQITEPRGRQVFKAWIAGLWFAPTKLKRFARSDHGLQGVYIPYWTYDSATTTWYTGQRGDHYWVTQTYRDSKGNTRTRRVQKTRWRSASGVVGRRFDDVLVLASDSLPTQKTDALEPWDLPELIDYDPAFLAGFTAEAYRLDLEQGFAVAEQKMKPTIEGDVRADIGGDVQRIASVKTHHDDITFKHVLLPLWISSYRWHGRVYRFLINGRTGEVQGERPYSYWKIAGAVLGGLAALGVAAVVFLLLQSGSR